MKKVCNGSDIDAHRFMRWAEPRELGMLAYYDQTPYQEIDSLVLDKHPIVKMWEEAMPLIFECNPNYTPITNNT